MSTLTNSSILPLRSLSLSGDSSSRNVLPSVGLTSAEVPLQRLLPRHEATTTLESLALLSPKTSLALFKTNGQCLASAGPSEWNDAPLLGKWLQQHSLAPGEGSLVLLSEDTCGRYLHCEGGWVGCLLVRSPIRAQLSAQTHALGEIVQRLLQQSWDKRTLVTETLECYRELNLLYRAGEAFGRATNPQDVLNLVMKECQEMLGAQTGLVVLNQDETQPWQLRGSIGDPTLTATLQRFALDWQSCFAQQNQPVIITEPLDSMELPMDALPFGSLLWAPMHSALKNWGGLLLARERHRPVFSAQDKKLLIALSWQATLSIENVHYLESLECEVEHRTEELRQQTEQLQVEIEERKQAESIIRAQQKRLEHIAHIDSLSGLFNRRYLFERAHEELERALRHNLNLSAMLIDIDHFKSINDTYGHPVGDEVIQQVGELCQESLRGSDLLGRYGGEEFAIFLPETDLSQAYQLAERLRSLVESHIFQTGKGELSITCSIGVASLAPTHPSLDKLFERTDQALYTAKRQGRNRVERDPKGEPVCNPES